MLLVCGFFLRPPLILNLMFPACQKSSRSLRERNDHWRLAFPAPVVAPAAFMSCQ